jgi:hypothetical protein
VSKTNDNSTNIKIRSLTMIAQKEISKSNDHLTTDSHDPQRPTPNTNKEKWLQKYASRILMVWSQWQSPLGVAPTYTNRIKTDLARFYDDPLKKMFIEATY